MSVPIQSQIFNPITGVFGTGQLQIYGVGGSGTWVVPPGIGKVRVRLWGGGGGYGGGGGFALKTITDLAGVTSIPVIVGGPGGTSSFGQYVYATGGQNSGSSDQIAGIGVGGDINYAGGNTIGGGAGSLFGNGGSALMVGGSGAAIGASSYTPGFLGTGGTAGTSGMSANFSIDFIGTGGGGTSGGMNGGGGITYGGYPGGGSYTSATYGAPGMVIVEW